MHLAMALGNLRSNKVRTILTLLGIIIGVTSVTVIIGIGEGIKQQVSDKISTQGNDIITIVPGRHAGPSLNLNTSLGTNVGSSAHLTKKDVQLVKQTTGVSAATGVMQVNGIVSRLDQSLDAQLFGVSENYLDITGYRLADGEFFNAGISNPQTVVLSSHLAENLFGSQNPISSSVTIKGQEFTVIGVMKQIDGLQLGQSLDEVAFVPQAATKSLNQDALQLQQINFSVVSQSQQATVARLVKHNLERSHGEEDFTILTKQEMIAATSAIFLIITGFTAAVASISLLVGGIGVMNIMLVTVTERTKEIGIRKAIGATSSQIMLQFLIEALAITLAGGVIGILTSLGLSYVVTTQTVLQPVVSPPLIGMALAVSLLVGIIFGTWPAVRAARKDPTASLKHE